jgi:predicted transcriptional regulator
LKRKVSQDTKAQSTRSNASQHDSLSRRERQIMDIVYAGGKLSVNEVRAALPDPPSYSAVRALLGILKDKGHLRYEQEGTRYVYLPTKPREQVATSTLQRVVQTFFGGSVEQTVTTLLSAPETRLSSEELERLSLLIENARREEAKKERR